MKNTIKFMKPILAVAVILTGVSCEKFLTADPIDKVDAGKFFSNETELELYANGMMNNYTPDALEVGIEGDRYCDFVCTKTSQDYNRPGVWGSNKQGGWDISSWRNIRRANIMLDRMVNSKGRISESLYNHYEGVGRFWRAYFHYAKMQTFGNIPWIDHALDISEEAILQAPRTDREELFHYMLEDMNFACKEMLTKGYERVINRNVALAFKARACLYEGTYRKYHKVNPSTEQPWSNKYETAEDILKECVSACEELMQAGFSLTTGNPQDTANGCFAKIWRNPDLTTSKEAIWIREYSTELAVMHELTWRFNSGTYDQQPAPTKTYINMFLTLDGTPIETDKVSLTKEFDNRDYRLINTVNHEGWTYLTNGGDVKKKPANMSSYTYTGYNFIKWSMEREENFSKGRNENHIPIFRYAEVLLNYAEAKVELGNGTISADDWAKTIGALRIRAGIKAEAANTVPTVADPWLANYYSCSPIALTPAQLEIRRERVCEMGLEHLRLEDLYRWHCGNLVVDRDTNNTGWKGIWVTPEEAEIVWQEPEEGSKDKPKVISGGLKFNGGTYIFPINPDKNHTPATGMGFAISNKTSDLNYSFSEGDHGYIIYNYKLEWNDRMYVHPIPDSATTLNENLGQNPHW